MGSDERIGLVLSGGAGKGAFEMGAIKALTELGIIDKVKGVSGTSVGALNMALLLSENTAEQNERIWKKFGVYDFVDLKPVEEILKIMDGLAELDDIDEVFCHLLESVSNGKIVPAISTQNSIKRVFNKLDFDLVKLSRMDLFSCVTDISMADLSAKTAFISWKDLSKKEIGRVIRGSASIPGIYKPIKTKRDFHIMYDGGLKGELANTPIAPLYYLGYRKLIVIYLDTMEDLAEQISEENKQYGDADIYRIIPDENFSDSYKAWTLIDEKRKKKNIDLGYRTIISQMSSVDGNISRLFKSHKESKDWTGHSDLLSSIKRRIKRGDTLF